MSILQIAGETLWFLILVVFLVVIYAIGCVPMFLGSRLIHGTDGLRRTDWLFGALGFALLVTSWLFWWIVVGRGVYGWPNMMNECFWAGLIGGLFVRLRVWLAGLVSSPRLVSIVIVAVGIFAMSFFLCHLFDL